MNPIYSYLPGHITALVCGLFALVGAVMGSALNCLALRLVSGQKWSGAQRSACPACGHTLGPRELVPVVSWLAQGGKCRHCRAPISMRYPIAEATLAAVYGALALKFGPGIGLVSVLVFASCLFTLSLVDLDTQIIPDRFILIPIAVRTAELVYTRGPAGLSAAIPGLIIAGSVLAISLVMEKILKKEAMGGGDIKLLFVIGLYLSLAQCLLMVMVACIIGIVMASVLMKVDSETAFPFGPALSIAAIVTMLAGDGIIGWYMSLF